MNEVTIINPQLFSAFEIKALRIALILFAALVIYWILKALARKIIGRIPQKRLTTILSLLYSLVSVVVFGIAALIILREFNIDIAPILASAGIAGLAIGFGAQTLVHDLISGVFLLTEDQIRQGDIVKIGEFEGEVEKIGIRSLTLKDLSGALHIIPNSKVGELTNLTRESAAADILVGVATKHPVDEILKLIAEVCQTVAKENKDEVTKEPEILGIEEIANHKLQVRVIIATKPKKQFRIKRRFNYLIKKAFEAKGFEFA